MRIKVARKRRCRRWKSAAGQRRVVVGTGRAFVDFGQNSVYP